MFGWLRRERRDGAPAWAELPTTPAADSPLGHLTLAQLCGLWRKSRSGLHAAPGPAGQARVVAARAAILDELERRNPQAMADWLATGGLDVEGPAAYVLGPVGHQA